MTDRDQAFQDWVDRAREQDMLAVAISHGAKLRRAGSEHIGPCPQCHGRDRFAIAPSKGKWICRGAGGGSDAIGMLQHIAGLSFLEACQELTGEPPPRGQAKPISDEERAERERKRQANIEAQRRRDADEARRKEERADTAASIWAQCRPIAGTLAETYLHGRGLPTPLTSWPDCFGFHQNLWHELAKQNFPALVARVDDVNGRLTAVWRVFLSADGKKAAVDAPKLGLGPAAGGAVRIGGIGPKIGIAEGIETAVAAWWLAGLKYPVWAALSTSGVSGIELPLDVERVTVYPDGDLMVRKSGDEYLPDSNPPGIRAARTLQERLGKDADGKSICKIAEVPEGGDFLDAWRVMRGLHAA